MNPLDQMAANTPPPSMVTWWQFSPLFYALLITIVSLFVVAIVLWNKHKTYHFRKRVIITELNKLDTNKDIREDCNRLVKLSAMHYLGRSQCAQLSGNDWLAFLAKYTDATKDELAWFNHYQLQSLTAEQNQQLIGISTALTSSFARAGRKEPC
ncbi:DUF4381 domain-containing protein [Paraferrimonas sp. SM1919]|uniref:DUF4381 domain-containing protein n=1 Tax=Paraferrimonas sp. SM1919 TaxID=2662263 RepID=UPI0013D6B640|nr:DUF4381 domain-containing protein [Paraferrimonas sp. SM1919]